MARGGSMPLLSAHRISPDDDPDFYPTPPWAGRAGAEIIRQLDPRARTVWEPACGAGHLVHALKDHFRHVLGTDAYPYDRNGILDFLDDAAADAPPYGDRWDWIVTNPPFNQAEAFIRQAWLRARRGVAMLLKVAGLETIGRYPLLTQDCPLTVLAPFSERVPMHKGRWEPDGTTAAFYAWFLFLKPELRPGRFMARGVGGELKPAVWLIPPGTEARLTRPDDAELFGAIDRSGAPA